MNCPKCGEVMSKVWLGSELPYYAYSSCKNCMEALATNWQQERIKHLEDALQEAVDLIGEVVVYSVFSGTSWRKQAEKWLSKEVLK